MQMYSSLGYALDVTNTVNELTTSTHLNLVLKMPKEKFQFIGKYERVFGHSFHVKIDKGTICKLYQRCTNRKLGVYSAYVFHNGEFILTIICNQSWKKIN